VSPAPAGVWITLAGDLDAQGATELTALALGCLHPANAPGRLTMDLINVCFCNTEGLRALLKLRHACDSAGWTMAVVNVGTHIRQVFDMTGLAPMLNLQPTPPSA